MDENRTTPHDILIFILNTLLIMGAIAVLLSIDGGRWLTSNPAFYDQSSEAAPAAAGIPGTGAQGAPSGQAQCAPSPAALVAEGLNSPVMASADTPPLPCQ